MTAALSFAAGGLPTSGGHGPSQHRPIGSGPINPEPSTPPKDHRQAVAERNVEAILEAAERLLERRTQATISAVAAQARFSRVTVYTHFPTREQLLEAVAERTIRTTTLALDAAGHDEGSAADALDRALAVGWRALGRYDAIAQATA